MDDLEDVPIDTGEVTEVKRHVYLVACFFVVLQVFLVLDYQIFIQPGFGHTMKKSFPLYASGNSFEATTEINKILFHNTKIKVHSWLQGKPTDKNFPFYSNLNIYGVKKAEKFLIDSMSLPLGSQIDTTVDSGSFETISIDYSWDKKNQNNPPNKLFIEVQTTPDKLNRFLGSYEVALVLILLYLNMRMTSLDNGIASFCFILSYSTSNVALFPIIDTFTSTMFYFCSLGALSSSFKKKKLVCFASAFIFSVILENPKYFSSVYIIALAIALFLSYLAFSTRLDANPALLILILLPSLAFRLVPVGILNRKREMSVVVDSISFFSVLLTSDLNDQRDFGGFGHI